MSRILMFALLIPLLLSVAEARTVEGVELDESVTARDGTELLLHGAGVRDRLFFDIYVGALYLPSTGQSVEAILAGDQPARIEMHFLYKEVEAEKLESAWQEGFSNNNQREVLDTIEAQLENFVRLFPTAVEGDVFVMEYLPGQGTQVIINGETAGAIAGDVFFRALLGVFLGPKPADGDLRRGMLGGE